MRQKNKYHGQSAVTVLIFVLITLMITTSAIVLTLTGSLTSSYVDRGTKAYYAAEAGVENGIIRLLKDPSYTGETLSVADGTAEISVTGTNPYTITSVGRANAFVRTVEVKVNYTNYEFIVTSWQEK